MLTRVMLRTVLAVTVLLGSALMGAPTSSVGEIPTEDTSACPMGWCKERGRCVPCEIGPVSPWAIADADVAETA